MNRTLENRIDNDPGAFEYNRLMEVGHERLQNPGGIQHVVQARNSIHQARIEAADIVHGVLNYATREISIEKADEMHIEWVV
jgi:hypothetical protein